MEKLIQIVTSFFASAGFALLFNVHGRKTLWIGVGGALSWAAYLLVYGASDNMFMSLMIASAAVVAVSEILAREIKVPVTMLMAPMLIPMVPGGALYYTMSYLVRDENTMFAESLRSLLLQAGAIAAGIIVTTSVMTNFFAIYYKVKNNRK